MKTLFLSWNKGAEEQPWGGGVATLLIPLEPQPLDFHPSRLGTEPPHPTCILGGPKKLKKTGTDAQLHLVTFIIHL